MSKIQQLQSSKELIADSEDLIYSEKPIVKDPLYSGDQIKPKNDKQAQAQAQDGFRVKFNQLHPAQEKIVKHGGLQFDIKLGWMPRAQISGPIPIAFAHPDIEDLLQYSIPKKSILYLGYRPSNTFDVHKKFYGEGKNYPFNQFHLCKSQFLERFFKKYYSDYEFNSARRHGMQKQNTNLVFDSFFEGGNLDAVYEQDSEYKLLVRVDTNTKGHCNYFYFKQMLYNTGRVTCNKPGSYIFRIMNMGKPKSLYQRGMKPYIRKKGDPQWRQDCYNVRYSLSKLCQQYQLKKKMYSLKFCYQFEKEGEVVQFCYGIPYTYTNLLESLNSYRNNPNFHLNKLCYTLSGLEIPLLTITEPQKQGQEENDKKLVVVISARAHPGETHGSHIVTGLIKSLLSSRSESIMLRKNIIFKIIPMINPDGVVIGNTRTSFSGKDLNRVYTDNTDFVFPEIIGVRDYTKKMKSKYGNRFLFFIDIHGHSVRKNSFFFGPEYPIFEPQYEKCRLLPKIFSNITNIFRYYSCKFRLSSQKQKTCRGYFNNKNIVRTYTFETSMHCYFDFQTRKEVVFTQQALEKLGEDLVKALHEYVRVAIKLQPSKIVEPLSKKKVFIQNPQNPNPVEEDDDKSDDMESDKNDSEDSDDDLPNNELQMFFNKINENREYFYEQLMSFNNLPFSKSEKNEKKKKKETESEPKLSEVPIKEFIPNIKENSVGQYEKKNIKSKMQWVPRVQYIPRKKQFIAYQKVSNVIYGGGIDTIATIKSNILYSSRGPFLEKRTRYTFVNPKFQQERKMKSLEPKDLAKQSPKVRLFQQKEGLVKNGVKQEQRQTVFSPIKTHENQKQIHFEQKNEKMRNFVDRHSLQQLISSQSNFNLLGQVESRRVLREQSRQPKYRNGKLRQTSLKMLPRKKSIKNFKNQEQKGKKIVKNMSEKGLATKLPYLERIIDNF